MHTYGHFVGMGPCAETLKGLGPRQRLVRPGSLHGVWPLSHTHTASLDGGLESSGVRGLGNQGNRELGLSKTTVVLFSRVEGGARVFFHV